MARKIRVAFAIFLAACGGQAMAAEIEDVMWRIVSIAGDALETTEADRLPSLTLDSEQGLFSSTVGCNLINGGYTLTGQSLELLAGPMTLMACPPPLDEIERTWTRILPTVREAIVEGSTMQLRDHDGATVATLEWVRPQ